jgi:hypothetical protein
MTDDADELPPKRDRRPRKWRGLPRWVLAVRLAIPQSWFTKRGPGVEAAARSAFYRLSRFERGVAVVMGWVPRGWL